MKFYLKFLKAFLFRFRFIIFLGVLGGIIITSFFIFVIPNLKTSKSTREGVVGRFTPNTLPYFISSQISKGLVVFDSSSNPQESLAKSWKIQDDGKKWIFNINQELFWQNGDKIKTDEINYNFENVSVTKTNDSITFSLNEPYVPFIALLEKPIFKNGLVGLGDWTVKRLSLRAGFVQKLLLSKENEKKEVKFYPTEEQAKIALKMGEIDVLRNISTPIPFDKWSNFDIKSHTNYEQTVVIFINTNDEILSDKNIRMALNYSVDKNIFDERSFGPISPKSFYFNPQVKPYDFDQSRANELIKEAKVKIPEEYSIKLISTPNLIDTAEEITKQWKSIGINSRVLVSSGIPSDYQAFITIFDIPKDPDQYSLWHSSQNETNITNYQNLRIDKLLEEGRVEMNKEERKRIYLDFQRYLMEDSPAIFLYHPVWYDIIRK